MPDPADYEAGVRDGKRRDHLRIVQTFLEDIQQKGCSCEPEIDIDSELRECAPCMARYALNHLNAVIQAGEPEEAPHG